MLTRPAVRTISAITLTTVLLAGCGGADTAALNADVIAPVVAIETLTTGTPAERVRAYNYQAKEAQAKLELLLEQEGWSQPAVRTSFFQLVPTAYGQDADIDISEGAAIESEVGGTDSANEGATTEADAAAVLADLIEEIQTYTELALEAAEEVTDPVEAAVLLADVQETQAATVDVLDAAADTTDETVATIIEEATVDVTTSIETVDAVVAEVADAAESGAETVTIDIPTDVETYLTSDQPIILAEKRDPRMLASRHLAHAVAELASAKEQLVAHGVDAAEADAIVAKLTASVSAAKTALESGDPRAALDDVRDSLREVKQTEMIAARADEAKARYEQLKTAAEGGDALAAEQLTKVDALLAEGKAFADIVAARRTVHEEFKKEAATIREQFRNDRTELREEFRAAKRAEATGEMTPEEFAMQKDAIKADGEALVDQRIGAEKKLRVERKQAFDGLQQLPEADRAAKLDEIRAQFDDSALGLRPRDETSSEGVSRVNPRMRPTDDDVSEPDEVPTVKKGQEKNLRAPRSDDKEVTPRLREASTMGDAGEGIKKEMKEAQDDRRELKHDVNAARQDLREKQSDIANDMKRNMRDTQKESRANAQDIKSAPTMQAPAPQHEQKEEAPTAQLIHQEPPAHQGLQGSQGQLATQHEPKKEDASIFVRPRDEGGVTQETREQKKDERREGEHKNEEPRERSREDTSSARAQQPKYDDQSGSRFGGGQQPSGRTSGDGSRAER